MNILFCSDPLNNRKVDCDWQREYEIAKRLGLNIILFDYDNYKNNTSKNPFKYNFKPEKLEPIIYRGWMMPTTMYKKLYKSLLALNFQLINSPEEYQHCYYLPDSYELIKAYTPLSVFISLNDFTNDQILKNLLSVFGHNSIIVKDYVKSQKYYWNEACFIPDACDLVHLRQVVNTFIEKQGENFQGGLVFREFIELEPVGSHPKCNMPLTQEYRIFVVNKKPIVCTEYWEDGNYKQSKQPDFSQFQIVFESIKSNFFTVDIAKKKGGGWIIMELGDGQVAEYLGNVDFDQLYTAISNIWCHDLKGGVS